MSAIGQFRIEPATIDDTPLVLKFIRGLAEYEKLEDACVATEDGLRKTMFGANPMAEAVIGYSGDQAVGFALFFHTFSTFLGAPSLYLEDLFVLPEWRGKGLGRQLLSYLASLAADRGCQRLEWAVLDWNEPSIGFYKGLGAVPQDEWTTYRLSGEAVGRLGGEA